MVNLKVKPDSFDSQLVSANCEHQQDRIRLIIADDQNSIREMLYLSLVSESDLEIVGSAVNGKTAIEQIAKSEPDIALIDIEMPEMDGLKATQIIKEHFTNTKVIILSSYDREQHINQALTLGAQGYLLKTTPIAEIANAIRYVHRGYLQLGPGVCDKLNSEKLVKSTQKTLQQPNQPSSCRASVNHQITNPLATSKSLKPLKGDRSHLRARASASPTKQDKYPTERHEWSSLTKELIETLPQAWTRGILYLLMILVGVVLPWAMLSKVDETGSARGKLEPQGKVFTVDTPVAGTVDQVFVQEGQLVQNQQPLLSLESEPVKSELKQIQTKLEGQQQEVTQLKLLKNQLILTVNTQKQQNTAQLLEKQAQLEQARQDIHHSQMAQNFAAKAYDEAKNEVKRYLDAKNQGIVSEIQVVEKEDLVRERERLLEQANSDTQQAQLRLQEQEKSYQSLLHSGKISVLRSEEQLKELGQQIVTLNSQIKEYQSQIDSLKYQLAQRVIKAPTNGSIFQLPVHKTGSVLEPGALVAEIAPQQSSLILKAQMPPPESGSLESGMPVKLKFDAYPFQDYGIVEGKLVNISPTTKVVHTDQGKVESYELEIKLDQDYVQAKNKRVDLRPGQTATAEVIVRQRRLIDFVLDPFKKLHKDGLEL